MSLRPRYLPRSSSQPDHDDQGGLVRDVATLARRRLLVAGGALAGGALLVTLGCGGGGGTDTSTSSGSGSSGSGSSGSGSSGSGSSGSCTATVEETGGPYPADGSNTLNGQVVNALVASGIVRTDIRSSFGDYSGTADGVPLTLELTLENTNGSCAVLADYAIYVWHCDRDGDYSLYGIKDQNYLRGVQATDASGVLTFTTIFPGCYSGRMPHIHVEVYRSLTTATQASNALLTTQIAFPVDTCTTVYATADGYATSKTNFASLSFATDGVFSDGTSTEMSTVTGDLSSGYTAALTIAIAA